MSPKFKQEDGFVFRIFSNEEERMHIHVVKAENEAKITKMVTDYGDDFKKLYAEHIGRRVDD